MAVQNVASTSSSQMAYIKESETGKTPTSGKGVDLRFTGESLNQTVSKEVSKEIEASRQTRSMFVTNAEVGGGVNFELSAGEYDPLIEALLMDTWSTFGNDGELNAGTAVFAAGAKTITLTNAATGLEVGDYFSIGGRDIKQANKGPHRVKQIDGAKKVITVYGDIEDQSVSNAKAYSGKLVNGTTERSFTLEKRFTDIDQTFVYRGSQVSKASFNFDMRAAVTGSFDFIGMTSAVATGRQLGDKQPYTPSKDAPVIDTVLGMKDVLFNGVPVNERMSAGITKLGLEYDNSMQGVGGVGVLGNLDVLPGTINVSGTLDLYLNNAEAYNAVISQERFRIEWAAYDRDGHGYAFVLPSVELDSPEVQVGQKDEAAMITLKFNALMDPTLRKTMIVYRF